MWRHPEINGIPFVMGGAATDFEYCTDVDVFFTLSTENNALEYHDGTVKIGEFLMPEIGKKVQVLASHHNVFDTLNLMDLSVHQWALDQMGRRFGAPTATMPNEPIRQLKASADKTPERVIKLSARYGQPVVNMITAIA